MLDRNNLVQLAKVVAKANPSAPTNYSFNGESLSYSALNETLRNELNSLAGDHRAMRENKDLIFSIMEETIDDVLPKRVEETYKRFAEVVSVAQGQKVQFKHKLPTRARAKQFITRVGLAGIYEVFKLGKNEEVFEVRTSAIGGACQVGLEEFLDGRVDFAEMIDIILEGMDELIQKEVAHALKASINQLPPANRVAAAGFDEKAFDQLINIAAAYGTPVIYCTNEFAVNMIPQEAWRYTEGMKDELWRTGRLANYKQWQVVILDQGFEDGTNSTKVIDPGYAWIIPTSANGKPVKIVIEGDSIIDEYVNKDRSREYQIYKKVGVACMLSNDICAYVDTSLVGQMKTWNLNGASAVKNVVNVVNG